MDDHFFQNLALRLQLARIFQVLPLAATTPSKMTTGRRLPPRSRLQDLDHGGMKKGPSLPDNPHLYPVAWHGERNENHLPFMTPQSKTTVNQLLDRKLKVLRDNLAAGFHK